MQTSLQGIAQRAKAEKRYRFGNLYGALDEAFLHDCWRDIRKDAANGVDAISAAEYERNLSGNIKGLVERLKQKRYHAKLVRRKYIPKEDGKKRPLGIPAVEDKLLQLAVAEILKAIYEQDFLDCSHGYRPKRSVHEASEQMMRELQFGAYGWIVEADIKGYFDNIDHEWLIRMLEERINDKAFTRLIRKWLKAGVLEDGKVIHPMTGTPQGGVVSPVLANIYLHYVLDLWFEKKIKLQLQRKAFLIRYADDFLCGFEREGEARMFIDILRERLKKFGLTLSEEKTRVIEFRRDKGEGGERFDFLGFEYFWGINRKGNVWLKRRTSRKKLRSSLRRFVDWCKANRHENIRELFRKLNQKLLGYYTHYGVIGNLESLEEFYYHMERGLHRWLNKRSQRRSVTWARFRKFKAKYGLMRPRIFQKRQPFQLSLR